MRASMAAVGLLIGLVCIGCAGPEARAWRDDPVLSSPAVSLASDTGAIDRGKAIARNACSSCHAVALDDTSRLPEAPPFRVLVQSRSLDDVESAMSQGLMTGHPAMPLFTFRASEIDDLIAYLDSLREGGHRADER